jgi:hypothetical protein
MRTSLLIFFLTVFSIHISAQNKENEDFELKFFTASNCFECMKFEELILQDPFFQTYASGKLKVTIHHENDLSADTEAFEKFNQHNIYPLIILVKHKKNDYLRLPYNDMPVEDFVYLINKLRR